MNAKIMLYVGISLSYPHICNAIKRHTKHLRSVVNYINPEDVQKAKMDHAHLIIYECASFSRSPVSNIDLDIDLVCHAQGMAKKNIQCLLLSRGLSDDRPYQVHEVNDRKLYGRDDIGSIWYNVDNEETSTAAPRPGNRFFKHMDWENFEKRFVLPLYV
jgi:hypothetical protein